MDRDAGQDTGSACSIRQGNAAASDCTPSGLGKAWHISGYGLFQWEMPMATWPSGSNPAGGVERDDFASSDCLSSLDVMHRIMGEM